MPRLRKVELAEVIPLLRGKNGLPGPQGPRGLPGETKVVTEVVEKPVDLKPLRDEIEELKKKVRDAERALRTPIQFPGGSQTGSYHRVTSSTARFSRHSFMQGINIIGVASGEATTIYLPNDMDPTHIVCVKDELGVANIAPITVMVSPI